MKKRKILVTGVFAVALIGLMIADARAQQQGVPEDAARTVRQSMQLMRDFVSETGVNIPPGVLENSAGVAIIPEVTRVAFFAGGRHGTGVLLSHDQEQWSLPVFASISGGSVGAQIGATSTDVVLVFRDPETISELQLAGKLDLSLDLTVAAGPVGGTADWSSIEADVLAYRRTGGLFAGLSIAGGSLSIDPEMTFAYYEGAGTTARGYYEEDRGEMLVDDILSLEEGTVFPNVPRSAMRLKRTMDRLSQ